ncbi:MAG TPA: hypothetical protein VKQ72_09630, partial [Aggregatilineales bacterium]|nr:hypothetical protein [Aggregatilineales bacterium]
SGSSYVLWGSNATGAQYLNGAGAMLYNASSTWSAENKVAILDVVAASYSSLAVIYDTEIQFNGFIQNVKPDAHQLAGGLTTQVDCIDFLQLLQTTPFNLSLQVNQTEDQLIKALLSSLPAGTLTTTPVGTLLDRGLTTIPYAFDGYVQNKTNTDPGTTYLFAAFGEIVRPVQNKLMLQQALDDVLKSSQGRFWQDADGTLRFANRNQTPALQSASAVMTIVEGAVNAPGSAVKLDAMSDVNSVLSHVFVNYHPRQVGSANVVLAQLNIVPNLWQGAAPYYIPPRGFDKKTNAVIPGQYQFTLTFHDAAGKPIGATSIATPVADSDFIFVLSGTSATSGWTDITRAAVWPTPWASLVTFSYTYAASQAVVTCYNWSAHPLWISKFQLQGIPLYTYDPLTIEVYDTAIIGANPLKFNVPLTLDQPFTNDPAFSQSLAAYVLNRFKNPYLQGKTLTFKHKDTVAGQDVLHTNVFDVVLTPDSQAGLTSSARHFVVGKQWQYSAQSGGILDQMQYILERCDPALYVKFDDASVGTYDGTGVYYI